MSDPASRARYLAAGASSPAGASPVFEDLDAYTPEPVAAVRIGGTTYGIVHFRDLPGHYLDQLAAFVGQPDTRERGWQEIRVLALLVLDGERQEWRSRVTYDESADTWREVLPGPPQAIPARLTLQGIERVLSAAMEVPRPPAVSAAPAPASSGSAPSTAASTTPPTEKRGG
jgi:hypothetical protein